jgi:hypothetical protein
LSKREMSLQGRCCIGESISSFGWVPNGQHLMAWQLTVDFTAKGAGGSRRAARNRR